MKFHSATSKSASSTIERIKQLRKKLHRLDRVCEDALRARGGTMEQQLATEPVEVVVVVSEEAPQEQEVVTERRKTPRLHQLPLEIIQSVLVDVDATTAYTCLHVCRQFRTAALTSKKLLKRYFGDLIFDKSYADHSVNNFIDLAHQRLLGIDHFADTHFHPWSRRWNLKASRLSRQDGKVVMLLVDPDESLIHLTTLNSSSSSLSPASSSTLSFREEISFGSHLELLHVNLDSNNDLVVLYHCLPSPTPLPYIPQYVSKALETAKTTYTIGIYQSHNINGPPSYDCEDTFSISAPTIPEIEMENCQPVCISMSPKSICVTWKYPSAKSTSAQPEWGCKNVIYARELVDKTCHKHQALSRDGWEIPAAAEDSIPNRRFFSFTQGSQIRETRFDSAWNCLYLYNHRTPLPIACLGDATRVPGHATGPGAVHTEGTVMQIKIWSSDRHRSGVTVAPVHLILHKDYPTCGMQGGQQTLADTLAQIVQEEHGDASVVAEVDEDDQQPPLTPVEDPAPIATDEPPQPVPLSSSEDAPSEDQGQPVPSSQSSDSANGIDTASSESSLPSGPSPFPLFSPSDASPSSESQQQQQQQQQHHNLHHHHPPHDDDIWDSETNSSGDETIVDEAEDPPDVEPVPHDQNPQPDDLPPNEHQPIHPEALLQPPVLPNPLPPPAPAADEVQPLPEPFPPPAPADQVAALAAALAAPPPAELNPDAQPNPDPGPDPEPEPELEAEPDPEPEPVPDPEPLCLETSFALALRRRTGQLYILISAHRGLLTSCSPDHTAYFSHRPRPRQQAWSVAHELRGVNARQVRRVHGRDGVAWRDGRGEDVEDYAPVGIEACRVSAGGMRVAVSDGWRWLKVWAVDPQRLQQAWVLEPLLACVPAVAPGGEHLVDLGLGLGTAVELGINGTLVPALEQTRLKAQQPAVPTGCDGFLLDTGGRVVHGMEFEGEDRLWAVTDRGVVGWELGRGAFGRRVTGGAVDAVRGGGWRSGLAVGIGAGEEVGDDDDDDAEGGGVAAPAAGLEAGGETVMPLRLGSAAVAEEQREDWTGGYARREGSRVGRAAATTTAMGRVETAGSGDVRHGREQHAELRS